MPGLHVKTARAARQYADAARRQAAPDPDPLPAGGTRLPYRREGKQTALDAAVAAAIARFTARTGLAPTQIRVPPGTRPQPPAWAHLRWIDSSRVPADEVWAERP